MVFFIDQDIVSFKEGPESAAVFEEGLKIDLLHLFLVLELDGEVTEIFFEIDGDHSVLAVFTDVLV